MSFPLSPGAHSPTVGELRGRLAVLGYDTRTDSPDLYGDATQLGVIRFQRSRGLETTGDCDDATWAALVESEFLLGDRLLCLRSPMTRGEDVSELQLRLGTLGFDSGRVDGIFGPLTQRAVGAFQRNAGLISDEVCGPDTVSALRRLESRSGKATVTSVRERIQLQRSDTRLSNLRIALGAADGSERTRTELGALLAPSCKAMAMLGGDWSDQAQAANDFEAHVYLGLQSVGGRSVECVYFAAPGFESVGGRALAECVVREFPVTMAGTARGMRIPILRETRAPAVLVKLGDSGDVDNHRDLVITALYRALEHWTTEPLK